MAEHNISHVTSCDCSQEGWCQRHGCFKDRRQFLLCQRSLDLFLQWEHKIGPGQDSSARESRLRVLKTPCRHRSAEPVDEIPCALCGAENRMLPVYGCAEFGECTLIRTGNRTERALAMGSCIGCERYEPATGNV